MKVNFLLMGISISIVLMGMCSCAVKEDSGESVSGDEERLQRALFDTDIDGDGLIANDPNPNVANIPNLSISFNEYLSRFNFKNSSNSIQEFSLEDFSENELIVEDHRFIQALGIVRDTYLSTSGLNSIGQISKLPEFKILKASVENRLLNRIRYSKLDPKEIIKGSGKLIFDGKVELFEEEKGIELNEFKLKVRYGETELKEISLNEAGSPVRIDSDTRFGNFELAINDLDDFLVRESMLVSDRPLIFSFSDFDLKGFGKERRLSKLLGDIFSKTIALTVIKGGKSKTDHIAFEGSLSKLLKSQDDDEFLVENGEIRRFQGLTTNMPRTKDISKLKDDFRGRWEIISNRQLGLKSKVLPGDHITLIYVVGDELARKSSKTTEIHFSNLVGKSNELALKKVENVHNLTISLFDGKHFGSRGSEQSSRGRRYPNGCNGSEVGTLLTSFENVLNLTTGNESGNFNLFLNQDELDLGQFAIRSSSEDLGAVVLKSFEEVESISSLRIEARASSGSFNKKLHRNTCYGQGYHAEMYNFGSHSFKSYRQISGTILIEHY